MTIDAAVPGSTAEKMGLQHGDVVVSVDGAPVAQPSALVSAIVKEAGRLRHDARTFAADKTCSNEIGAPAPYTYMQRVGSLDLAPLEEDRSAGDAALLQRPARLTT